MVLALQIDRQLRAAPFGSAGMDFGDQQVDFHGAGFGIVPKALK
jgi:hypothetical protein